MSCRLPPVSVTVSGVQWRSTIRWCLELGRARPTGEGPTWSPALSAQTCDPSTEQLPRSSRSARRSSGSRAACRRGQTSASVHSRSRCARQPRRNSSRPPPGCPARRHRSAARTGHRRVLLGQEHATTRDAGGVVRERAAATGPPAPTGRPEQDQHAPGCLPDQDRRVLDRRHLIVM